MKKLAFLLLVCAFWVATLLPARAVPTADAERALVGPSGVAVAPNGRVYVALYPASRVWSWPNTASLFAGDAADLVFGLDPDTQTGNGDPDSGQCAGATTSLLCGPESVAVDSAGNLYLADTYHHRVLIYLNPDSDATPTAADGVLGQSNFTNNGTGGGLTGYNFPRGLALDAADNLYIVDEFNHRVLRYDTPLTTDTTPDAVLGQADFNGSSTGATATKFNLPLAVAVDGNGHVYVTDLLNGRVQRFAPPLTNGMAATQSFTGLNYPHDVAVDSQNRLYIADTHNQQILQFLDPINTPTADNTFADLYLPMGMAFDLNGDLLVADCGLPASGTIGDFPPCRLDPRRVVLFAIGEPPPPTGLLLNVDVAADRAAISPDIYGLHYNFTSNANRTFNNALADELGLTIRRWGGNDTTRYNWQNNRTNSGYDYFFENNTNTTGTESAEEYITNARASGTQTIVSVPLIGWVANDNPLGCGYSVSKYGYVPQPYPYGSQPAVDPWRTDCGSGITGYTDNDQSKPIYVAGNDPLDTSIASNEAFVAGWVAHLHTLFGTAANGGVRYYSLDNEPDLWHETHRDVHPAPSTYDEVYGLGESYAAAIKAADPSAQLLGPVPHGWSNYFYSRHDLVEAAANGYESFPDYEAHGSVYFVPWYLQQMAAYEQTNGTRLLDYLDIHFYPQNGVSLTGAGDSATQALRLRSTRGLWDATYVDESWIAAAGPNGGIVRLIPMMREWIDAHYPGTKLAITEYNWGALDSLNGALAQADILGIFGRERVDMALLFDTPFGGGGQFTPTSPAAFAFRIYRNYDGAGGRFGQTSVQATSEDQGQLAIYAAQRSADGALTLVIINKTGETQTGTLNVANFAAAGTAEVYRYSSADLNAIVRQADAAVGGGEYTADYPANSITLLVLPRLPLNLTVQGYLPLVIR